MIPRSIYHPVFLCRVVCMEHNFLPTIRGLKMAVGRPDPRSEIKKARPGMSMKSGRWSGLACIFLKKTRQDTLSLVKLGLDTMARHDNIWV